MSRVAHLPVVTRVTLTPDVRRRIEAAIERMVEFLDLFDGPETDMEPALGAAEFLPYSDCNWSRSGADADEREDIDEREIEDEHGGDVNDEPQDDNELDGHAYDDMEPGADIPGGLYRGPFRPSSDVIGDRDIGAGR